MKIVLANGCFDVLHLGHIYHLEESRGMGDYLIVALTVDKCVNKGDGRPVMKWFERAQILRSLRCVDTVIPTENLEEAVKLVKPSIVSKGIDYAKDGLLPSEVSACRSVGAEIRFTKSPKMSSTAIIERISS